MDEFLIPNALEWDTAETVPEHVFETFAKHNMLIPSLPAPLPAEWLHKVGIHDMLGLKVEEFDYLHFMIYTEELARTGLAGPSGSLTTGMSFGVPPLLKFGNKKLQEKFLPDALTGKTRFCIAITEPDAGSDVANVTTTAEKTPDGKFYIVNGAKKWITNGVWSQYSSMAVRTGGPGASGLSMLVVPLKDYEGVTMKRLKVGGQVSAGTTYIELDDVKVPVENLIGEEGMGMKYIMVRRIVLKIDTERRLTGPPTDKL
jgi:acyl-CoA dehydrogenase